LIKGRRKKRREKEEKISCGEFYQLRTSKNIIYEGDNKQERFLRDIECLPQAK
jgi:hypothetical protein